MKILQWTLITGLIFLLDLAQSHGQEDDGRKYMCDGVCKAFTCGTPNRDGRVVGGTPTSVGKYPWLAFLTHRGRLYCAATLINNRYLITAAHCLQRVTKRSVTITLGSYNKSDTSESSRQVRKASEWWTHDLFERRTFNNDIGIIKLDEPVSITKYVRPACLPATLDKDYVGSMGIVPGWGRQQEKGKPSEVVREVRVPIMSNQECKTKNYKPEKITSNMLCAGYDEGNVDACQGDSGGPLLHDNGGNLDLIGVVSWGHGCARARYPGVYTRITKYMDFISSKIDSDGCSCPRS